MWKINRLKFFENFKNLKAPSSVGKVKLTDDEIGPAHRPQRQNREKPQNDPKTTNFANFTF